MIFRQDKTKVLEVFVDTYFAGGWEKVDSDSAKNVMSQTCYVNKYDG